MFIAEVKTQSPFGFKSDKSWDELFEIANEHGDMISIHTNPLWGGSFELITKAYGLTKKPILAKGLHNHDDDIMRALCCGAHDVLVVGRMPKKDLLKFCIIEPMNLMQLSMIPVDVKACWNSRELTNGQLKTETWEEARKIFDGHLIQASNIKSKSDLKIDSDSFIVGQHLENFIYDYT